MSIQAVKGTRIGTLHVRGATDASVALRLALSSLLNSADLRPVGIPPAAILIVRRLADPMPGRVAPQRRAVRVDGAWEKATQNALADLYRRAARPSRGYVSPHAPAVLFADEGEMLASLALDISRGYSRRWWWKRILPVLLPSSAAQAGLLPTLLCREARSVPAVLHHLAQWGQLFSVAKALSPAQAMSVLSAMTKAHDVGDLSLDLRRIFPVEREEISRRDASRAAPRQEQTQRVAEPQKRHALATQVPWARWLPPSDVPHTLAKEQVCLLGVGLSLHYRPAMVPTHPFRHALRQWWAAPADEFGMPEQEMRARREQNRSNDFSRSAPGTTEVVTTDYLNTYSQPDSSDQAKQERTTEPKRASADQFGTPEPLKRSRDSSPTALTERPIARHLASANESATAPRAKPQNNATDVAITFTDVGTQQRHRGTPSKSTTDLPSPQEHTDPSLSATDLPSPQEHTDPSFSATDLPSAQEPTDPSFSATDRVSAQERIQKSKLQLEGGVVTELGGLLYLINLMAHLELPACFEKGWHLASQIGPWGVLEVLGRALLGAQRTDLAADPIWEALATLDDREVGHLPGADFVGHDRFRLPKRWLSQLREREAALPSEERWYWGIADSLEHARLRIWSMDYLLVDVPLGEEEATRQVEAELRAYLDLEGTATHQLSRQPFDEAPLAQTPLIARLSPHLARWLAMVLPYIRHRLYQALGISPAIPTEAQQKLVQTLLLCRGRLYVTSTHVDLVMRLEDISLPVRLAGLDFDPGWLANVGRVVKFHFE